MAKIDHVILKINDVPSSVDFYINVMGFTLEGERPPFTVIRVSEDFVMQLAPWGTEGNEHLAFSLSRRDFAEIGARGSAPTLYFNDPNKHLIEIRTYG